MTDVLAKIFTCNLSKQITTGVNLGLGKEHPITDKSKRQKPRDEREVLLVSRLR